MQKINSFQTEQSRYFGKLFFDQCINETGQPDDFNNHGISGCRCSGDCM